MSSVAGRSSGTQMAPAETMPALPMGSSGWGIAVTGVSLVMSDRRWKRSSDHPRAPITQDDAADEGLEPIAGRATLEQVGRQGFRLLLGATELRRCWESVSVGYRMRDSNDAAKQRRPRIWLSRTLMWRRTQSGDGVIHPGFSGGS